MGADGSAGEPCQGGGTAWMSWSTAAFPVSLLPVCVIPVALMSPAWLLVPCLWLLGSVEMAAPIWRI